MNSLTSFGVLLLLVVLALSQIQSSQSANIFQMMFGNKNNQFQVRLNKYLESKVSSSSNVIENLTAAKQLLESNEDRLKKGAKFELDLAHFVALGRTLEVESCGQEALSIFLANDKSIKEPKGDKAPSNRALEVLRQVKTEHARLCRGQYERIYREELAKLNETMLLEQMQMFLTPEYFQKSLESHGYLGEHQTLDFEHLILAGVFEELRRTIGKDKTPTAEFASKVIRKYATVDTDGKVAMKCLAHFKPSCMSVIKNLLIKYIEKPCDYFVDSLGPKVFLPHDYDVYFYPENKDTEEAKFDWNNLSDYQLAFARFHYCRFGLRDRMDIQKESNMVWILVESWALMEKERPIKESDPQEDESDEE